MQNRKHYAIALLYSVFVTIKTLIFIDIKFSDNKIFKDI